MSNETIWIQGGNLIQSTKFMGDGPIYLYGSLTTFRKADDDNAVKITDNVGLKCDLIGSICILVHTAMSENHCSVGIAC